MSGRVAVAVGVAVAAVAALASGALSCARAPAVPRASDAPPTRVVEPPAAGAGQRRPLVVFLHGLGSSADEVLDEPPLAEFARRHGAVVLIPEGSVDGRGRRFWNAGEACCNFDRSPVDDVRRLTALIDAWRARPDIDPRRVYVIGFSNGGFMAHRLACRIGDRLAAVASLAGAGPDPREPCAPPPSPLGVLEAHGDGDHIVPFAGGRVFHDPALAVHPSAAETMRAWATRLGCTVASTSTAAPPAPAATLDLDPALLGAETAVVRYPGCRAGSSAELWTVHTGRHALGTPALFDEVWRFLARHAKPPR